MSTHRVLHATSWAYLTPEAYADEDVRSAIVTTLVAKANGRIARDGWVRLPDRDPVLHTQTQVMPLGQEPHPSRGGPWVPGDIIPPGWHLLHGMQISVAAYDPEEQP